MQMTISKPQTSTGRVFTPRHDASAQDKMADLAIERTQKTFVARCDDTVRGQGLASVIRAMYYLPQNFVIMLPRTVEEEAKHSMISSLSSIIDQVQFYDSEGSSNDEPSFVVDAVIRAGAGEKLEIAPTHVGDSLVIGNSSTAVASALLNVSRSL